MQTAMITYITREIKFLLCIETPKEFNTLYTYCSVNKKINILRINLNKLTKKSFTSYHLNLLYNTLHLLTHK